MKIVKHHNDPENVLVVEYGKCSICGQEGNFKIKKTFSLREAYCPYCQGSKRNRDLAKAILKTFIQGEVTSLKENLDSLKHLAIFEAQASGPIHRVLCGLPDYVCSEYFEEIPVGSESKKGICCENLESLTFPNNRFDLVITQDVLEHVRNPEKAFLELNRVLKPGGFHIFTVPIHEGRRTVKRVEDKDGKEVFHRPPVHHGDPLRGEGSLVCTDFGDDLVEYLKSLNLPTEIISRENFYAPDQIPRLDETLQYEKYLVGKAKGRLLDLLLYNSIVFRTRKEKDGSILAWTGERFVPWAEDPIINYEHLHRYAFAKEFVAGKNVIDLASGEGYGSALLAETAASIIGVDIDEVSIRHASRKYQRANLKFIKGSITDIPIEGHGLFDVAICFEALEHISNHGQLLQEIKRLLKREGVLIISTPNKKIYSDEANYQNPFHLKELYFEEFKNQLSAVFQKISFFGQKIFPASNIFAFGGDREFSQSFAVERKKNTFAFVTPDQKPARYFIAVATDQGGAEKAIPGESYLVDVSDTVTISLLPRKSGVKPSPKSFKEIYPEVQELIRLGKYERAIQALEIAVAQFPKSGLAYNDLGFLFYLKGEKGRALKCYRKAIELDPNLPVAMKNLADFYLVEDGEVQKALAIYNRLLKNCPEDTEALLALGFISSKTNRPEEALSFYKRVLEVDPDNPTAKEFLKNEKKPNRLISPKPVPSPPSLVLYPVESLPAYRNYLVSKKQEYEERQRVEQRLIEKQEAFFLSGHCYACGKEVDFLVPGPKGSPNCQGGTPNWRESLICPNCKLSNRQRASFQLLMDFIKPLPDSKIYIAEQNTPFFRQICRNFPHAIGSEYLGTDPPFGAQKDGIRNEDLTALTFGDNELDYIVVLDVFEHIPKFEKAFQECWRTLKPQGILLFSVPFERNSEKNIVRAIQTPEGKNQFLFPPEYHGDPVKRQCLCYQIFGWDILNQLREIGFENVKSLFFWSKELGYLGEDQVLFVAQKAEIQESSEQMQKVLKSAEDEKSQGKSREEDSCQWMKEDWNKRALEDPRYYIHSTSRGQTDEEFDRSGKESMETLILKDPAIISGTNPLPTMRILEIGCGMGRMTKYLAEVFGEVHGVDISGEMIRMAKERLGHLKNAFFYEGNGRALSMFPNEFFDFAFSFIVFQHIPDKVVVLNYIREACRVLKTTGVFKFQVQGCTDPQWLRLKKDTWQGETVTEADIRSISAELGFEIIEMEGQGTQYSHYTLRKREMEKKDSQGTSPSRLLPKRCTIVIPVFNKLEYTIKCIEAIRKNTPNELYELVIVDNASTDGTKNFLSQSKESVRIIFNSTNVGFTQACNQGAREASGEFILFLNNDTEPQPGWLEALIETMEAHPEVGIVGSKLIYPDGRLQEAGGIIFRDGSGWNYGRFDSPEHPRYNYLREVDYVSGASLLIRAALLEKLGLFDEQYSPGYYEDTDICFGARAEGYKVLYCPFSMVIHHEGISSGTDLAQGMKQYQIQNRDKFLKKWESELNRQFGPGSPNVIPASERNVEDNILIIDPFLPMFDRASGSLRLFTIVKILRELNYHVTFIARNGMGQERYADILRKMGVEVYATDPEILHTMGYKAEASKIDLKKILASRFYRFAYLSFFRIAEQYLPAIRTFSPRTIILVDSVDIHFLREKRMAEVRGEAKLLQQAEIVKRDELFAYRLSDALITVTEEDWKSVTGELEGQKHFVIPNIHFVTEGPVAIENRSGLIFVGNFSHPPNEDGVRFFVEKVFPLVKKSVPDLQFTVVGNNPTPYIQTLQKAGIKITGYVPSTEPFLRNARISIAPLTYGAGMKGKIGEAMAQGLPVVTTSIGAEGMGLVSGENAIIADTPEEFASGIIRLCQDDFLWIKLARAGKEFIRNHFSYPAVQEIVRKILNEGKLIPPKSLSSRETQKFRERNYFLNGKVSELVSIIILTWNQLEFTKKCVESIRKNTPAPHEIIFVDNGSTDGTVKWLKKLAKENPQYTIIENKSNSGFAKGCNQGVKASKGEFLLLLNNDARVTPNWLSGMLECLNRNQDIGIVGPMTNQISGIQKIPDIPYPSIHNLDEFARSFRGKYRHRQIPSRRIVGFCMLFRKELVERIGLLDESFGTGNFEDDDFSLRAELEGFSNVIAGDVFIHHFGSRSFIGNQIDYRSSMGGNRKIFLDKWKGIDYKSPLGRKLLSLQEKEEAWKFYHQDQLEKAADKFLTALKISPQDEDIYLSFGEMLIDAKRFQEAFEILKQLPPEKRNDQIYARLGYCLEGLGKIAEAEEFAEKSLSVKPGNALALNSKGILAYRRGQKEEAVAIFQKAIQADPGYGEPYTNLGVIKWEEGEKEEALNFLERGFILSPTSTDNLQLYHSAVSERGAFERAEKFFAEAEALYLSHKKIQYLLIDVLLRQEKNEAAMERIESSIAHFGMDEGMMKAALEVRKKVGPKEIPEKGEKGTVSLCMIVKDEEKYLARCLQSAKTIVDEMIVVDTGSSDRSKELATIFGAKIFDFAWENDFSSARNDSLSKASGDWILVLDADEMISEKDHHFLCNLRQKKNGHPRAFSFVTRNYVNRMDLIGFTPNDGSYPEEEGAGWTPSEKVRLFPNDRRSCFENPVHEMIRPALEKNQVPIQKCPVPVHHYGKLDSEREKEKGERYYALGRKKLELHSDLSSLTELAIQAGALGHFDEAISLWNQVLVLDPKMTDAYINLSYNHLKLKKYADAAQLAQRARELDPDSKEGLLNYSSAEFLCGNIERVVASLEDFLQRCPEYPPILGLLSLAYFLEGKIEKGLPLVEKLKRIGFDYKEYVLNSAQDLIAAGQEKKAEKLIEIIKKSHKQPLRNAEMGIG